MAEQTITLLVNTPEHEYEYDVYMSADMSTDDVLNMAEDQHKDWTSIVLTIVNTPTLRLVKED